MFPAFTSESGLDYYHPDVAAGRFVQILRGPEGCKSNAEAFGAGIIGLLNYLTMFFQPCREPAITLSGHGLLSNPVLHSGFSRTARV